MRMHRHHANGVLTAPADANNPSHVHAIGETITGPPNPATIFGHTHNILRPSSALAGITDDSALSTGWDHPHYEPPEGVRP